MFGWFEESEEIIEEVVPKNEIDFSNFHTIAEFFYEHSGITDLDKRVLSFSWLKQYALDKNINTTADFLEILNQKGDVYQDAINIVTVNETYFFREKKELEYLVEFIKNSPKKLKIISLPCSSGEEIYSILIMMQENNIPLDKIEITGYDIDLDMIKKAKLGIYNEYSLHNLEQRIVDCYFTKIDNSMFEVKEFLKSNIDFKQQNIFEIESVYDKYDVVLSRNMMIYFDDKKRAEAMQVITNILRKDGIFIKGHADSLKVCEKLENVTFGIFKKI